MAIVLDGNLGITTPAETVQGALTTTGNTILGDASTDTLNVGNGGLVKDASGNVGIGTASPAQKLSVNGADASNNVALFTRSGGSNMYFYADTGANVGFFTGSNAAGSGVYANATSNTLQFNTNGSERARIDSSGNLLVGKTADDNTNTGLVGKSAGTLKFVNGNGTLCQFYYSATGGLVGTITHNSVNTTYATSSDYRLKENIAPMTGALARVTQLKPVTYTWKIDGSDGEGFIAHELQAVVPDCVTGEKDAVDAEGKPVHQGIDTSFLVATLTAAIQELKAIVDAQAVRIAALES
jgi:hypothetical protein